MQYLEDHWKYFSRVARKIAQEWTVHVKMAHLEREIFERAFYLYDHIKVKPPFKKYSLPEDFEPKVWSDFESSSELLACIPDCPELARKKIKDE